MKPLSQHLGEQLQIVQPSIWKRVYELRTAESVLLTMTYPKLFSTRAIVTGFGEIWEIYKPSIWRSNLEIRKEGNQLPIAKFVAEKWGRGGVFELPNGERLKYVFKLWKGHNEIHTQNDQRLLSYHRKVFSFKPITDIILEQRSVLLDKYPWTIMAVYYLMLERRNNAAH